MEGATSNLLVASNYLSRSQVVSQSDILPVSIIFDT